MNIEKEMADQVPTHTLESLSNYLMHGYTPGGFLESMLAMDMERALVTADVANRQRIWNIGYYILHWVPREAWGDYNTVQAWCANTDDRRTKWNMWNELTRTTSDRVKEQAW